MKAEISELLNGWLFRWPEYSLTVKATRVRIPSDGQVKGELTMEREDQGQVYHLLVPTHFNFSAELSRQRYAKQLGDKLDLGIEWREIFDYLCERVQYLARAGESYVEVYPEKDTPPPERLLGPVIYKGVQNIIFGEKGTHKSTIAYVTGFCLTLPWTDNPLDLPVPKRSVKGLVLDWETDEPIFRYYLSRMQRGMNIPVCSLFYRRCTLPLVEDIEPIQQLCESTGAELLIIDSLGAAAGADRGELKGAESALRFNAALRSLKMTSLIIAQTSKDPHRSKSIFGSTFFTYYARNIWELVSGQDDFSDTQHVALMHRECNLGKKVPPLGIRIDYNQDDDSMKLEREAFSPSEFAEKASAAMRILEAVKRGAMTSTELTESLDLARNTVDAALSRLRRQRRIMDTGGKKWGLTEVEF